MKLFLIPVYFVLLSSTAFSQNSKIPFIPETIDVDGNLNESVWEHIPEITNFYNYMPTDIGFAENQTAVKIFHNGQYLFVSAVFKDSEKTTQVSSLKRDVSIGLSDAFIVILDTQNQQQNAYYFAVNSLGAQVDGLVERINEGYDLNLSWNAVWKASTSMQNTEKHYEIAIPFKTLSFNYDNPVFGLQLYNRNIKENSWSIMNNVKRNYRLFDLRFTTPYNVENLPDKSTSEILIIPSITSNYHNDILNDENDISFKPSIDMQYNLTSSLKIDATINPDFSQIDVDQQVTNLTRFSVFFPEQRNFFLENGDLFSNLGTVEVNPFYSRKVGIDSDMIFGIKLSGNVSHKLRIGLLTAQTDSQGDVASQNFSTLVTEYQLSNNFATTAFLIHRQQTNKFEFINEYNRVTGVNINFKSDNKKWIGLTNFGTSYSDGISDKNNFYHTGIWFNQRDVSWNASIQNIGKNYITDVGFTPRLYNYDAINDLVVREGYTKISGSAEYQKFYEKSKTLNAIRYLNFNSSTYFDNLGAINQAIQSINSAIFFKNLSSVYYVFTNNYIDLKYGFDPLNNGNPLIPDIYNFRVLKIGYNSTSNQKLRYRINVQKGNYYSGKRTTAGTYLNYQILPFANIEASYDINTIDLHTLGKETFHLAHFTGEVFFNNRLNWTTYVQYNTQSDNFNINSRLQWEYKPLSYMYVVLTDTYNQNIYRKNWGIAFKMNYRLDF